MMWIILGIIAFLGLIWPAYLGIFMLRYQISKFINTLHFMDKETKNKIISSAIGIRAEYLKNRNCDLLDPIKAEYLDRGFYYRSCSAITELTNSKSSFKTVSVVLPTAMALWKWTVCAASTKSLRPNVRIMWDVLYSGVEIDQDIIRLNPIYIES